MDPSPVIAAGDSVGLFIAIAGLLFRMLVLQSRRERQNDEDIHDMKLENAWCNKRVSILIFACQQGGISIPPEVWDGPPQIVMALDKRRSARRRRSARDRPGGDSRDAPNDDGT